MTLSAKADMASDDNRVESDDLSSNPTVHEVEDRVELELPQANDGKMFRAHWQLFIPTLVIAILYGMGLLFLWMTGRSGGALFRLFAIVLAVGIPLLATHAFLRYETLCLHLGAKNLRIHVGWPKDTPIEIPYKLIDSLKVKRGLSGRLMGGGTVLIKLTAGNQVAVADLKEPEKVADAFEAERLKLTS